MGNFYEGLDGWIYLELDSDGHVKRAHRMAVYYVATAAVLVGLVARGVCAMSDIEAACTCKQETCPAFCAVHGEPAYRKSPTTDIEAACAQLERLRDGLGCNLTYEQYNTVIAAARESAWAQQHSEHTRYYKELSEQLAAERAAREQAEARVSALEAALREGRDAISKANSALCAAMDKIMDDQELFQEFNEARTGLLLWSHGVARAALEGGEK